MFSFDRLIFTETFDRAYADLAQQAQKQCDKALNFLQVNPRHNSLRLKPILPAKIYWEARVNTGDRIILRPDGKTVYLVDVVTHDEIGRYGS